MLNDVEQEPVPLSKWDGVLDASREGPTCIQYDGLTKSIKGTEDCLVVNVYTGDVCDPDPLVPLVINVNIFKT